MIKCLIVYLVISTGEVKEHESYFKSCSSASYYIQSMDLKEKSYIHEPMTVISLNPIEEYAWNTFSDY